MITLKSGHTYEVINQFKLKAACQAVVAKSPEQGSLSKRLTLLGLADSTINNAKHNFLNAVNREGIKASDYDCKDDIGLIRKGSLIIICNAFGLNEEDYIVKEKVAEVIKEELKEDPASVDLTEIEGKLNEIISDVIKLGNIQMQMLEYIKSSMDSAHSCAQYLKQINDRQNKPQAYKPPYHK